MKHSWCSRSIPSSKPALVMGLCCLLLVAALAAAPAQPPSGSTRPGPAGGSLADLPGPLPTEVPPSPAVEASPTPLPEPSPSPRPAPARPFCLALAQAPADPAANAWYVGQELGIFKKHGLDIALVDCLSWDAAGRAVAQGYADGMAVGPHWPFFGASCGFPARIVLATHEAADDRLVGRGGVHSLKQLKKRRVGARGGSSASAFLAELLRRNGMSLKSIRFLPAMTSEELLDGWRAGTYDAIVTWEPYLSRALRRRSPVTLARSSAVPGIAPGFVAMTPGALEARPEDVKRLVESWYDIVDWIRAHPHEADLIVSRHAGQPLTAYSFGRYGVRLLGREENPTAFTPRPDAHDYSSLVNLVPFRLRLDRQTSRQREAAPADVQVDARFVAPSPGGSPAPAAP